MTLHNSTPHTPTSSHWAILGAGAMGCLWAAYIQKRSPQTAPVTMLVRDDKSTSQFNGQSPFIRLETTAGQQDLPINIASPDSYQHPLQWLLIATKAHDVGRGLDSVAHLITPQTVIIVLQNGLKPHYETVTRFGANRVVSISTSNGAYLRSPFHVVHAGAGETWVGQLSTDDTYAQRLVLQLPCADLNIRYDTTISQRLWRKFAINCSINILTALYQIRNGELLTHAYARHELKTLCSEVESILKQLPTIAPIGNVYALTEAVLTATQSNYSSTLQDVQRGQKTELAHLNRYLCQLARDNLIDHSFNSALLKRFEQLYPSLSLD